MDNSNMSLGKYVSIIHRHSRMYIDEKLKPHGIGAGQAVYMMALYHHDGIRQEDLCKSINIDKGTTARAIKKLESSGYVKRLENSTDKRAYSIHLTEKAHDFKREFRNIYSEWTETLVDGFSECQKETARELLQAMARNAVDEVFKLHKNKEQENSQ